MFTCIQQKEVSTFRRFEKGMTSVNEGAALTRKECVWLSRDL